MPINTIPAKLIARRDIPDPTGGPNLGVFTFEPAQQLAVRPGQFVLLGTERDGTPVTRPYSIAHYQSGPCHELEFFIGLVKKDGRAPDGRGLFTSALFDDTGASREYFIRANASGAIAQGKFILPADTRHAILIGTATGIAPLTAILRHGFGYSARSHSRKEYYVERQPNRRMTLISGVGAPNDLDAYHDEFVALENAERQSANLFTYLPRASRTHDAISQRRHKSVERGYVEEYFLPERGDKRWTRVAPDEIAAATPQRTSIDEVLGEEVRPATHVIMVCGNPGMAGNIVTLAQRRGFVKGKDVLVESW